MLSGQSPFYQKCNTSPLGKDGAAIIIIIIIIVLLCVLSLVLLSLLSLLSLLRVVVVVVVISTHVTIIIYQKCNTSPLGKDSRVTVAGKSARQMARHRKGGCYDWRPSPSSNVSIRVVRAQISQFELLARTAAPKHAPYD